MTLTHSLKTVWEWEEEKIERYRTRENNSATLEAPKRRGGTSYLPRSIGSVSPGINWFVPHNIGDVKIIHTNPDDDKRLKVTCCSERADHTDVWEQIIQPNLSESKSPQPHAASRRSTDLLTTFVSEKSTSPSLMCILSPVGNADSGFGRLILHFKPVDLRS